jgi:hypothetical protein
MSRRALEPACPAGRQMNVEIEMPFDLHISCGFAPTKYRISNKEYRMMKFRALRCLKNLCTTVQRRTYSEEMPEPNEWSISIFDIPCSIFDIHIAT